MGFKKAPSAPVTLPEKKTIPVVTETTDVDAANDYEQSSSHRKGLLSTILTSRREQKAAAEGNTTLG